MYFIILIDTDGIVDGLNSMTCKEKTHVFEMDVSIMVFWKDIVQ